MTKKYLPLLVFAGVFTLTLGVCLTCILLAPDLPSGQTIRPSELSGRVVFLRPEKKPVFRAELGAEELVLIRQGGSMGWVERDGEKLAFSPFVPMMRSLSACRISPASDISGDGWTLELELANDYLSGQSRLFLCTEKTLEKISALMLICTPLINGILLASTFYGLFMYFFKRMKMLIVFALYTFFILIWNLASNVMVLLSISNPFWEAAGNAALHTAVVLSAVTSFCFCRVPLPGRWKLAGKWYSVVGLCALNILISSLLSQRAQSVWQFLIYTASAVVLVLFCARAEEKPWVVLAGLAVTQALRFTTLWFFPVPASFGLILLRSMKVFTMPYLLSCMIYISSVYGKKFKESEDLRMALEVSNQYLDKKVAQRTMELQKQQQFRTNLLTNIFHDLRSPLMVMRGCVDQLRQGDGAESKERNLEVLDERLGFITRLTEDLFNAVKLEDPHMILDTDVVQMDKLVTELVEGIRVSARRKGFDIDCEVESGVLAWGDEIWLRRAIQNLLENAVYYSPQGGKNVRVSLRTENGRIMLDVQDFGVGISPEEQPMIFERYYQVSGTKKHYSSGLGLSIAMNTVRHHQGSLTVQSSVNEGTIFRMDLPLWDKQDE